MFVICKQVKKFTEHKLRHIGKALQVFLTNKTVLAEQKRDMWLYSVDLGWVNNLVQSWVTQKSCAASCLEILSYVNFSFLQCAFIQLYKKFYKNNQICFCIKL